MLDGPLLFILGSDSVRGTFSLFPALDIDLLSNRTGILSGDYQFSFCVISF